MNDKKLMNRAADNIRILAASMVEKAKSGHPGVVFEELAIEYVDEVGTAHSTTGVARLCLFYH